VKVLSEKEQIKGRIEGNVASIAILSIVTLLFLYIAGQIWDIWPVVVGGIIIGFFIVKFITLFEANDGLMDTYAKAVRKVKK